MGEVANIDGFRGVGGEVGKKCMWYSICHAQCGTQNVKKIESGGMYLCMVGTILKWIVYHSYIRECVCRERV